MKIRLIIFSVLFVFMFYACQQKTSKSSELDLLSTMMTGSFNSSAQAEADSNYFDITLHMVPIWEGQDDVQYLYVEQAVTAMQDKPYRQRIYELQVEPDATISSKVYSFTDPKPCIGKCKTPEFFDDYSMDSLVERMGCTVFLTKQEDGSYEGSTHEKDCQSSLRGSTYATSSVEILSDRIISWDRGFDAEDNHVWGAEQGGYVFVRIVN